MKFLDDILKQNYPDPAGSSGDASTQQNGTLPSLPEGQGWLCPICGGTGYLRQEVPVNHPDFGKIVKCRCRLQEQESRYLQELRTISNMQTMNRFTFETFVPDGIGLTEERRRNLRTVYETAR